jgi:hypothetical protein
MPISTTLRVLLLPTALLLIPLVAMRFTDEVHWTGFDFAAAWVLMATVALAYKLATRRPTNLAYRQAVGVAVGTAFLLTWANLAVGVIGDETNPANLMYAGVLVVGLVGAGLARMQPRGLTRAMLATAGAQLLVPVIGLLVSRSSFEHELVRVLVANTVFAALFAASALLFHAAERNAASPAS